MQGPVTLEVTDPRRIAKTTGLDPPPQTKELILSKKSRIEIEEASIESATSEKS